MAQRLVLLVVALFLCGLGSGNVLGATLYRMAGPGFDKEYFGALIQDISKFLAPELDVKANELTCDEMALKPPPEAGSVDLALCPSDFHFRYLQSEDREETSNYVQQFRVVLPVLLEEVHFIVRSDSPMWFIHETANRRVYLGPAGSRSELAGESIYRLLFYREAPVRVRLPIFSPEEQYRVALKALLKGDLDVVVMVGEAPIPLLVDPGFHSQGEGFRLLQFDADHPLSRKVFSAYPKVEIPKKTYPWSNNEMVSLGLWTYLICPNDWSQAHSQAIRDLVDTWFRKLSASEGKSRFCPSWQALRLPSLFPEDWQCYKSIQELYIYPSGEWYRNAERRN
jgi:hypothetical protein